MKILVNGTHWQEIKEANNFNELLLYLANKLKTRTGEITYWDNKKGILIDGKDNNGKDISFLVETEEQANSRIQDWNDCEDWEEFKMEILEG